MDSAERYKYRQVVAELRQRIDDGAYESAELPPVAELARELGVSPGTAQRALVELDREGVTGSARGRTRVVLHGTDSASATRYGRVASTIRQDIESHVLPAGAPVPGELDLAERFNVSRATVRQALEQLERSGHIERRAGRRYVPGSAEASDLAYERVATKIREAVNAGKYPAGGKLPGEHRLSAEFSVSRPTVRQALKLLETQGILYSLPKQGWYVSGSR